MLDVIVTLFLKKLGKLVLYCLFKETKRSKFSIFMQNCCYIMRVCRAVDFSRAGSQLVRHMRCGKTKDVLIHCIKKDVVQFNT